MKTKVVLVAALLVSLTVNAYQYLIITRDLRHLDARADACVDTCVGDCKARVDASRRQSAKESIRNLYACRRAKPATARVRARMSEMRARRTVRG